MESSPLFVSVPNSTVSSVLNKGSEYLARLLGTDSLTTDTGSAVDALRPEPEFLNFYGAQEPIPRNRFRQLI